MRAGEKSAAAIVAKKAVKADLSKGPKSHETDSSKQAVGTQRKAHPKTAQRTSWRNNDSSERRAKSRTMDLFGIRLAGEQVESRRADQRKANERTE